MTGLDQVRQSMTDFLREAGIHAVGAWAADRRLRHQKPIVAVSLKRVTGGQVGFRDYLGERYNQEKDLWEELYGRQLELVFGLDIYAPGEGADCQVVFDKLAEALSDGGPGGLRLGTLTCGEAAYDSGSGMFRCPVELECAAWMYAVADDGGQWLTDFEVKGEWK